MIEQDGMLGNAVERGDRVHDGEEQADEAAAAVRVHGGDGDVRAERAVSEVLVEEAGVRDAGDDVGDRGRSGYSFSDGPPR